MQMRDFDPRTSSFRQDWKTLRSLSRTPARSASNAGLCAGGGRAMTWRFFWSPAGIPRAGSFPKGTWSPAWHPRLRRRAKPGKRRGSKDWSPTFRLAAFSMTRPRGRGRPFPVWSVSIRFRSRACTTGSRKSCSGNANGSCPRGRPARWPNPGCATSSGHFRPRSRHRAGRAAPQARRSRPRRV